MAKAKSSRESKRPRRSSGGAGYRFMIDAYSPETIPMVRLAEYMRELGEVLGETAAVHFNRLEPGSTTLVSRIEQEAVPKVRARAVAVQRGEAPREALRAYKTINRMLREDNGVGVLKEGDDKQGAVIIRFPGREEAEEKFPYVREHGSVDGVVVWIGGSGLNQAVRVTLEAEAQQISGFWTDRQTGKELARKLFEPVRLFGRGRWSRDGDGQWTLIDFKIESFQALVDIPLSAALSDLRSIPVDWDDESLGKLSIIRHGPSGKSN
jgi:hypothetical protein